MDRQDRRKDYSSAYLRRTYRGLLEHLATLTRSQVQYTGTQVTIPMPTEPTSGRHSSSSPPRSR